MKRFVSLLLVIVLFVFGSVPASASGLEDGYLNVFDYVPGFTDFNENYIPLIDGKRTARINLPMQYQVGFVDMVVECPGTLSVTLLSGFNKALTVEKIHNLYYRVYGKVSNRVVSYLQFEFSSSASYVTPQSLIVSPMVSDPVPEVGTINGTWAGASNSATMSAPNKPARIDRPLGGGLAASTLNIYCRNWRKYDFLDFYFEIGSTGALSSITVSFNEHSVPFESSVIGGGAEGDYQYYVVHVVADLRGLDRTSGNFPIVTVGFAARSPTWAQLSSVTGSVASDAPNPVVAWFAKLSNQLKKWFTDLQYAVVTGFNNLQSAMSSGFDKLVSILSPDPKPGEDFGSTIESQGDQLGQAGDVLDSVTKPPSDEFDFQIGSFVDPSDVTFLGTIVSPLLNDKTVLTILLMSFSLAAIGYVLYGKR